MGLNIKNILFAVGLSLTSLGCGNVDDSNDVSSLHSSCALSPTETARWPSACRAFDKSIDVPCSKSDGCEIDVAYVFFDEQGAIKRINDLNCEYCGGGKYVSDGSTRVNAPSSYGENQCGQGYICSPVDDDSTKCIFDFEKTIFYSSSWWSLKGHCPNWLPKNGGKGQFYGIFGKECTPSCTGRACGSDGCSPNGCGSCQEGAACIRYVSGTRAGEAECIVPRQQGGGRKCDTACASLCSGARSCLEGCGC